MVQFMEAAKRAIATTSIFGEDLFFWSLPNFAKKTLQFSAKPSFSWCSFNFGDGIT